MQFQVIRTLEDWNQLSEAWNVLLSKSASHVPFLRHEYLTAWWQCRGGGEWPSAELFVVTAWKGDLLMGAAPLFFVDEPQTGPALMLLGSIEISDYLDLIARPEDLPEFIPALLEFLEGDQAPPWKRLDLYNLLDTSLTLPLLRQAAEQCRWKYTEQILQSCPVIRLPGNWDMYLSGIDKKQRHEIRRKMRRAEENPTPVRWYLVSEADQLASEMEAFFDLMVQDEEKARFLTPIMRQQMQTLARAAFDAGWLQLAFIDVDGQKAAGYINFDFENHIWVYNSGLNFSYRELSPGWVLLGQLLKWANENGRAAFDFMRGDEEYKYRFGATDRHVVRATLER